MSDYLLINKNVLPKFYEKVVKIKEMLNHNSSISEACKANNLSRSTYYKYKDCVHRPSINYGKKVIISLKLMDQKGVLSHILNFVANSKGNIISINQEVPIHHIAFVTITLDAIDMPISAMDLVENLKDIKEVVDVFLIAVE